MHKKFDSETIEKKWQQVWRDNGIYNVGERDFSKEKEYVLVEWPYPSGNLHIGHWYAFAVPDIYVRFKRMLGKQVLYPMGFDAFGLPAENAAIKRNLDPKKWTDENMAFMRTQLERMGNAFSWDKTTSSTDPEYFKWTQWMFTKFFEKDIAYRGKGTVNWCPGCNTVLANEQVLADDTCERCGSSVEKKEMDEWKMRITNYADRLVDDLDTLDWPEAIKESQRNWIGRSRGAKLSFKLSTNDNVEVFTTRPDTLFGATFLVIAPEHPLLEKNKETISNYDEVSAYVATAKQKNDQDRLDATKEKTGVKLEGITAVNPGSGEEIPVFVADYVLMGYGTGAIMAVPAHDERDNAFAKKFGVALIEVLNSDGNEIYTGTGKLINSGEFDGMESEEAKEAIVKKVGGEMTNTYRLRDWSIGRQRYWGVPIPIVYDPDGKAHPIPEEHLPWTLPTDVDFKPTGEPPLKKSQELHKRVEKIFGKGWMSDYETMDTFVDSSWYFLRYIDNKNDKELSSMKAQTDWMSVDLYFGGAEHTTMHLLYSRFWQKALLDLGLVKDSEPYKKRLNRGLVLGPDGNKMSKSKGNVIDPDEQVGRVGADTVKMYLAFMGPYGEVANYPWDMGGIAGLRRFLERVAGLTEHIKPEEQAVVTKLLHKTIKKVGSDIASYKFNTAISAMMIFVNLAEKDGLTEGSYKTFLKLLAPFAPHLTEELWSNLGNSGSIHIENFPVADESLAKDDEVTIGIQINGKSRGEVTLGVETGEDEAVALAKSVSAVEKYLVDTEVVKVIYVPGRIINFIVKP
ncbi:leucine--tRNA ligase [Candidatus Nomurabacteria bacterium]|nr:leucine--tRNA ligase [Candidatus Nomurabacteria bacterium]